MKKNRLFLAVSVARAAARRRMARPRTAASNAPSDAPQRRLTDRAKRSPKAPPFASHKPVCAKTARTSPPGRPTGNASSERVGVGRFAALRGARAAAEIDAARPLRRRSRGIAFDVGIDVLFTPIDETGRRRVGGPNDVRRRAAPHRWNSLANRRVSRTRNTGAAFGRRQDAVARGAGVPAVGRDAHARSGRSPRPRRPAARSGRARRPFGAIAQAPPAPPSFPPACRPHKKTPAARGGRSCAQRPAAGRRGGDQWSSSSSSSA